VGSSKLPGGFDKSAGKFFVTLSLLAARIMTCPVGFGAHSNHQEGHAVTEPWAWTGCQIFFGPSQPTTAMFGPDLRYG
jgi:hypothetical protein